MCKSLTKLAFLTLPLLALLLSTPAALAENSTAAGAYVIHHNALTTDNLSPEVASAYDIRRSKERAMLNVSVIRGEPGKLGQPVAAKVKATARNIIGQQRDISMREIREGSAIYYIGDFPVVHKEKLDFFLEVTPAGETQPVKARLRQQFYTD
jgi:hypothetical protein